MTSQVSSLPRNLAKYTVAISTATILWKRKAGEQERIDAIELLERIEGLVKTYDRLQTFETTLEAKLEHDLLRRLEKMDADEKEGRVGEKCCRSVEDAKVREVKDPRYGAFFRFKIVTANTEQRIWQVSTKLAELIKLNVTKPAKKVSQVVPSSTP
ncbi:MAG: hypothetical protein H0X51_08260 [Parachlamydiaceae bacterium]|nr:hypothetical protein [Parachlamydiaceae bacterium]